MKLNVDPIGINQHVLAVKTEEIIARFDKENKSDVPWWKCWAKIRVGYVKVTSYILNTLDEFILEMENFNDLSGPDKKATVMAAIEKVYDHIMKDALPFWLKPFNPAIKKIILGVIVSYAVDWIVEKYHNGMWSKEEELPKEG